MGTHPRIHSHICRSNMHVMIALGFLAVALIVTPSLAASSDDSITWGPIQNVTHSTKSFDPVTVVDSNNKTHIVYAAETSDGSSDNLMYTNNVNGSFSSPQTIQRNIGSDRFPFFSLALGPNNTLHLVYSLLTGDKQLYYRQGTLNGANVSWSSPQLVSDSGTKSIQPTIIVDSAGKRKRRAAL